MAGYTETQVMMTLAALAATGATERPSGETLADHKARILKGINTQLAMPGALPQQQGMEGDMGRPHRQQGQPGVPCL